MTFNRLALLLTMIAVAVAGSLNPARAQRGGTYGVQAATPLGDTWYKMSNSTNKEAAPQYTYFSFFTDSYEVTSIEVHVEYDESKLVFGGVDTTFFDWATEATFTVTSGEGYVFVQIHDIPARTFTFVDTLLKFTWGTECFTDGTNATLSMDTTATGGRNCLFVSSGNTYFPTNVTSGYVGIYEYTADVYGVNDTRPAGHTAIVPLMVTNNFDPNEGLFVRVFYDQSRLQFTGWDTVGAYFAYCGGGGSLTVDTSGNVITITSDCQYSKVAAPPELLMNLEFENNMTTDDDSGYVVVDSMKMTDCSNCYAVDAVNDTAWVITPKYTASVKYKQQSILKNGTANIQVQLKNTFEVDMDVSASDKRAAFHTKNSAWSLVSYNNNYSQEYTSGDSLLKWTDVLGTGDRIYKSNYGSNPQNIPPRSTYTSIMTQNVTAGSTTGWDHVEFTRDAYGVGDYPADSKLHSTGIDVTIHSQTYESYDSLFTLELDSIQVYQSGGGGGGSCPFVYTWDGSDYNLEDAVLTESEKLPEKTPVTDYLPLTFQPALENGSYRIRIHEEEAEKTFLDEAQLLVIDHVPGYEASVTTAGDIVFGNGRVHPWGVVDDAGNDVTQLVTTQDDNRFEGHGSGSLIATFNRREGEFYALGADDSTEGGKNPCEVRQGPLQAKPEPTTVRIEVEDAQGIWHELPTGPMRLPKTRVRPVIDLSGYDLPVMFRIRYSWDGDYTFDEIALSVQVPVEHTLTKSSITGITHSSDHPSAKLAAQTDGRYAELVTGEYLDLEFPASPVPEGMERSLVLKTTGYFMQWFGDQNAGRPLAFGLNGNYPNPFNPSTTIRYSLASDARVTLEVFNVLGQRVRTLIGGMSQPAGSFEVVWDGRDDQGSAVGSGAYLYRLTAGDFTETRKMVILK